MNNFLMLYYHSYKKNILKDFTNVIWVCKSLWSLCVCVCVEMFLPHKLTQFLLLLWCQRRQDVELQSMGFPASCLLFVHSCRTVGGVSSVNCRTEFNLTPRPVSMDGWHWTGLTNKHRPAPQINPIQYLFLLICLPCNSCTVCWGYSN